MKELLKWIIAEIEAGASASTLLLKLEVLDRIADHMSDYAFGEVVAALTEEDHAE